MDNKKLKIGDQVKFTATFGFGKFTATGELIGIKPYYAGNDALSCSIKIHQSLGPWKSVGDVVVIASNEIVEIIAPTEIDTQYILRTNGNTLYYKDKEMTICHRVDGPACEYSNGDVSYWIDGNLHRDDNLPALINKDGTTSYYQNGKLHRTDGPARTYKNNSVEYWVGGFPYSKEDFNKKIQPVTVNKEVTLTIPKSTVTKTFLGKDLKSAPAGFYRNADRGYSGMVLVQLYREPVYFDPSSNELYPVSSCFDNTVFKHDPNLTKITIGNS